MASPGSVSHWLDQLRAGDQAAAQPLWERYFERLVALARARLKGTRPRVGDEEDVALSAFDSFCRGAGRGRFPQLADRDELWRLLVVITARKAGHVLRDQRRQKRCGDVEARPDADPPDLDQVVGAEPSPEFAAQVAEETQRLLDQLGNDLRAVALQKMEGYTVDEIAANLDVAPRTVARKLKVIRGLWERETPP